ncbi:MAG: ABC transporter substrate-binding protein, partial [bacterium]|nr:ABC transporter substrate-binding protein [bacterium]
MTIRYLLTLLNSLVLLIWPQPSYTEGFLTQPCNLNPLAGETNDASRLAQNLIFQGLTKYNDRGELEGDLAESWEVQNEGLVYIVHLKKDVHWHDGQLFGANDVLYTAANFTPMQDLIIDRLDEYTLRFTLPNKYSPFLDLLTVKIIPAHIKWEDLNRGQAVGTGFYKLLYVKKRRDQTESITLGAATKEPKIKKIVFKFYTDEASLKTAAKLGEIDGFIGRNEWLWPSFKLIESPIKSRYYAIFFNNDNEAVKPSGVRKKLAMAVPTKEIIVQVFSGKGDEVNGPLDQTWAAETSEIKLTEEEEQDLKLPEKLVLTIPNSPEHQQTAAIIQKAWKELG